MLSFLIAPKTPPDIYALPLETSHREKFLAHTKLGSTWQLCEKLRKSSYSSEPLLSRIHLHRCRFRLHPGKSYCKISRRASPSRSLSLFGKYYLQARPPPKFFGKQFLLFLFQNVGKLILRWIVLLYGWLTKCLGNLLEMRKKMKICFI